MQHRFAERAGVLEYEAGMPRESAERFAWIELAVDWVRAHPAIDARASADAEAVARAALEALGVPDPHGRG